MLHCGLRVSEVVNLRPSNINLTKGNIDVENGMKSFKGFL
jgi:integrase